MYAYTISSLLVSCKLNYFIAKILKIILKLQDTYIHVFKNLSVIIIYTVKKCKSLRKCNHTLSYKIKFS